MSPEERDAKYLWDMLDSARAVQGYLNETTPSDYMRNRMMQRAVERELEIIGEVARKLSDSFKAAHQEIDWQKLRRLRNVIAHEYGEIRHERLWEYATRRLPELIAKLRGMVPPAPPEEPA